MAVTPSAARYITGHDASGKSVFLYEGAIPTFTAGLDAVTQHGLPWSAADPPDLADNTDTQLTTTTQIHTGAGSTARFLVVPPGNTAVMHRTATLDYIIIQKGEIVLELDDGSERVCREGDLVVQRGTNHAWHNRSDKPCQFYAIILTAPLPKINGKQLEASHA
ncbi:hypothetical protein CC85DRAFT_265599 [Cutaneotrichosporon oleaginosum]|uniref:Cupin type-2 domain-containing protein n=1 Tax=Cutaneotrichosporon oleaginosum TaxID=879819 RepID=A0A0J0XDZ6_9TREE|nr:uncharacterized protein CC85DRAFT_265599 [Cutaneotrichosporon oleaginosum]KLT39330.1 hypothetical protein CC85DRAFT_265599 [Cutaneotrichosporon oleaginosum]